MNTAKLSGNPWAAIGQECPSVSELARRIGMHRLTVTEHFDKPEMIRLGELAKIAGATGTTVADLLEGVMDDGESEESM